MIRNTIEAIYSARADARCYLCTKLISEDPTREHIIPEALGSTTASAAILCGTCNNRTGREIDNSLTEESMLHHVAAGKPLKSIRSLKAKRLDGTPYRLTELSKGDIKHPILIETKDNFTFQVPEKWTDEAIKGWAAGELKKRGINMDFKLEFWTEKDKKTHLHPIGVASPFLTRPAALAVMKTGCNWWASISDHPIAPEVIQCIPGGDMPFCRKLIFSRHMANHYQWFKRKCEISDKPRHRLKAVGNPNEGLAYVEVNLFDVQTFRVIIDYFYTETPFCITTSVIPYDADSRTFEERTVPEIKRKEIVNRYLWFNEVSATQFKDQMFEFAKHHKMPWKEFPTPIGSTVVW